MREDPAGKTMRPLSVWPTGQRDHATQLRDSGCVPGTDTDTDRIPPAIAAHAITTYTRPGDLVLDPDCGTGTVLTQALRAGRHTLGLTTDPHRWTIARANITAAKHDGARHDGSVLDVEPRDFATARAAGLAGRVALVLTSLRVAAGPGPDRDLDVAANGLATPLHYCTPLLCPGGHVVIVARPRRYPDGTLADVTTLLITAGTRAGLAAADRCVALTRRTPRRTADHPHHVHRTPRSALLLGGHARRTHGPPRSTGLPTRRRHRTGLHRVRHTATESTGHPCRTRRPSRKASGMTTRPNRPPTSDLDHELVIGSLCTGYGGLDLGVLAAFGGGRVAWVADPDPHVRTILAARAPDVPNLGDIGTVDWDHVEEVDIITAGFPCQDISAAGKGLGIRKGARSGIWRHVVHAVRRLRPALVVVENVAALRWRNGGLGAVLGDLADIGYDANWTSVRASDIGAPHRRERVFILAFPHGTRFITHHATAADRGRGPAATHTDRQRLARLRATDSDDVCGDVVGGSDPATD